MNRRTALLASMFLGGLVPRSLLAQGQGRKLARRETPAESVVDDRDTADAGSGDADLPAGFPKERGFQLKTWDISGYTRISSHQAPPEKAIIDWIFLRTGMPEWHGDRAAALGQPELRSTPTTRRKSSSRSAISSSDSPMRSRTC